MAYVKFNKTATLAEAKASTNPNKVFFPTDSASIVINGKERGSVTQVKVGSTAYNPSNGVVSLPAYPTSLPASDVYNWAKQSVKPEYAISEIVGLTDAINLRDKVIAEAISECKSDIIGLQNKNYTEGFVKAPYSANDEEIAVFDKETGTLIKGGGKTIANLTVTASTSADGLMSATDKSKLDGIASGATANIGTVTQVKVGATAYNPSSGIVSLPEYPTTLPASDVYSWAKQPSKPSYTANEVEAIASTAKGAANGVAELDSNGKVPSTQLPSYVDDVIECLTFATSAPSTCATDDVYYNISEKKLYKATATNTWGPAYNAEKGKIYVNLTNSKSYRWGGSDMTEIVASPGTLDDITEGTTNKHFTATEKTKLAGIESGAQVHKAPTSAEVKSALGTGSGTSKYLREDGTWQTPPNTVTVVADSTNKKIHFNESSDADIKFTGGTNKFTVSDGHSTSFDVAITPSVTKADVGLGNVDNTSDADKNVLYAATAGSAPASDVHSWAKQSNKPSYAINEITGLSGEISDRDRILAEAIAELKAEVEGLKKLINSLPQWVDAENGYMINGQKMFDVIDYDPFEESKPELPKSIGLIRYSTRSERMYVSISVTNDVNDWGVC